MTFWSGETIIAQGNQLITPFSENLVDCAAYTLRMGKEAYITPDQDVAIQSSNKKILKDNEIFEIPRGQFAFLLTKEYLDIPNNVICFISLKSKIKYRGLVNVSGFHVDPGFKGHLIFAVYNAGPSPIKLQEGKSLFLIWFSNIDNNQTTYHRTLDHNGAQERIESELLQGMSGQVISLQSLAEKVSTLNSRVTLYSSLAAASAVLFSLLFACLAVPWHDIFGSEKMPTAASATHEPKGAPQPKEVANPSVPSTPQQSPSQQSKPTPNSQEH